MNTTTRPELARARRQTTTRTTRPARISRRREPLRPFVIPVTGCPSSASVALLREAAAMLICIPADMCQRGELAGRIVSHLENSARR